jgi:YVTN family beta-propeller protein
VTVLGAGPTGASSSPSLFSAGGLDTRVVNEPTNDVAWDPWHGRLYASVPGTSATRGNSVLVIDPATGAVLRSVLVGSEPSRLAVSGDGRFLYVGLDGASAVKRYLLPDLTLDLTIPLGSHPAFGPYQALDLQVAPGAPGTVAVSLGATAASPLAQGGVAIFDEGMPRAERAEGPASLFDSLQWSPDAGTLYAANGETSDFDFYVLDVSPAGVALAEDLLNVFHTYDNRLHLDPGGRYLYSDSGQVLDTTTRLLLGTFPTAGPMVPAPDLNTAWFLTPASGQAGFFGVSAYHLLRLTPLAAERVPLVAGFDRVPPRLVRWGTQGLAACGLGQPLLISSGPFLATPAP